MIWKWLAIAIGTASLPAVGASCPHAFDLRGGSPAMGYVSDWVGICADGSWETLSERGEKVSAHLPPADDKQIRAAIADVVELLTRADTSPQACPHQLSVSLPQVRGRRVISVCQASARGRAAMRLHELARHVASYSKK